MAVGKNFRISPELVIAWAFGLGYLLIPTKMYYIDGVFYAEHLEHYPWYLNGFHPHHLLFLPIAHLFYSAFHAILPFLSAMTFLQATNAIFGALTLYVFSLIMKNMGFGKISRVFSIALLGFSYTFWHHASDANIYIPAHFLTLSVLSLVVNRKYFDSPLTQISSGLLLGFAGLIHQISLLAIFPVCLYLFLNIKNKGILPLIRFLLPSVLVVVITYPAVFAFYHEDVPATSQNFFRWIGAFGQAKHYFTVNPEYGGNLVNAVSRGHTNAFSPLKPLEKILFDEKSGDTIVTLRLYRYFLSLCLISVFIYIWIIEKIRGMERKRWAILAVAWFFVYFIFTSLFMPENHFYRIFYLPALIAIWAGIVSSLAQGYKTILKPVLGIVIVAFFLFNFSKGIIPQSKEINNPYMAMTRQIDTVADSRDLLIFPPRDRYFTGIYRYFGKGDALHIQEGKHFLNREKMINGFDTYEKETVDMIHQRYQRIFLTREAAELKIDPIVFSPNNYQLPHPEFMVIRRNRMELVGWVKIYNRYYAEIRVN